MRKIISIALFLAVSLIISCNVTPEVKHWGGTPIIYIETKNGRFLGVETDGIQRIPPVFNRIKSVIADEAYLCYDDSEMYLLGYLGNALCDSVPLINEPKFLPYKGFGIPGQLVCCQTSKGNYYIYADGIADWYQYGPFKDFVPGSTGYMFLDPKTDKWGIGSYGEWIDRQPKNRKTNMLTSDRYYFSSTKRIILQPRYERIVNIAYVDNSWQFKKFGFSRISDIRWYAYDGNNWSSFDMDGNVMPVKQKELQRALNLPLKPEPKYGRLSHLISQRLGNEKAFLALIVR